MTNNDVRRTIRHMERTITQDVIEEVERGLAHEDPAFVRRFRNRCRAETAAVVAVFLLLTNGIVLLTIGLATLSPASWIGGVAAFFASFAVHGLRERALERSAHS